MIRYTLIDQIKTQLCHVKGGYCAIFHYFILLKLYILKLGYINGSSSIKQGSFFIFGLDVLNITLELPFNM